MSMCYVINRVPLAIFLLIIIATLAAAPARAQDCSSSSYIPTLAPLTLRHVSGYTIDLLGDSKGYGPSVHIWENGQYSGEYQVPISIADGQIQVLLRMEQRLETWMGRVRQVLKAIPYVTVCGLWYGNLP
jgi:hypothetical protein